MISQSALRSATVRGRWLGLCCLVLPALACAANGGSAGSTAAPPARLPPPATYAELLSRAPRTPVAGTEGCLFVGQGDWLRLAGPLQPATQTDPPLLDALPAVLARAPGPARVLTPWGRLGPDGDGPVLVSLSDVPPEARTQTAQAAFVTRTGQMYLRPVSKDGHGSRRPFPAHAFPRRIGRRASKAHQLLFVAAEPAMPVAILRQLVHDVPRAWTLVLSAALPANTRLPKKPEPPVAQPCAQLPSPEEDASRGAIPTDVLLSSLRGLADQARGCMATARVPPSGRITLAMRVDPDGTVSHACLMQDEINDPVLAMCLAVAAKALRFPEPDPEGTVDVQLPLRFSPETVQRRERLCPPAGLSLGCPMSAFGAVQGPCPARLRMAQR